MCMMYFTGCKSKLGEGTPFKWFFLISYAIMATAATSIPASPSYHMSLNCKAVNGYILVAPLANSLVSGGGVLALP